ncbi:ATP-binding protein [Streptomyces sp. H27-C3]|uniref:ATP-binding protein n=1 Tax=Streptomyces sp. H27-C3 TaxID=3046305 RepID=UPI0024BA45CA|nr:ATP-binding protein [Streptomyces sp. H27-C3]MDJ0462670.1 ATP-binding protein [Streptomyces sp. H27-C3]
MARHQAGGRRAVTHGSSDAPEAVEAAEEKADGRLGHLRRRLGRSDLAAVPEVRRALRELLRLRGDPGRAETAELLTTEMVTNALVHTEHDAEVTVTLTAFKLRVEVRDFVARHPTMHVAAGGDSTHGRGLMLVQALADAWGVRAQGVGKVVWFDLDLDGGGLDLKGGGSA